MCDEPYLKAALKTPLIKIPGKAGIDPVIVITKYGSSWSLFLMAPVVRGSQVANVA